MKKILFPLLMLVVIPTVLFTKSLWNHRNIYHRQWKQGDILTLIFDRKEKIRFETKRKNQDSFHVAGIQTSGKWLNFLPKTTEKKQDEQHSGDTFKFRNEDHLVIPVSIIAKTNSLLFIEGKSVRKMFNRRIEISVRGQTAKNRIHASGRLFATDVLNLNYELSDGNTNDTKLETSDLLFETNFTEIRTNIIELTNRITNISITSNNQTNLVMLTNIRTNLNFITNPSKIELKLKGLSESKRNEILKHYLSAFLELIK